MTLLVHLRVCSVRRLGITAAVTTGTVVRVAVWSRILSHALRKTWTLGAVLRRGVVARGSRLVPDGRELSVWRGLSRATNSLTHLTIDLRFSGGCTLVSTLLLIGPVALIVSLAQRLFLLLLSFPLFADLLELYKFSSQQGISDEV
jgi:hypothetical protein